MQAQRDIGGQKREEERRKTGRMRVQREIGDEEVSVMDKTFAVQIHTWAVDVNIYMHVCTYNPPSHMYCIQTCLHEPTYMY